MRNALAAAALAAALVFAGVAVAITNGGPDGDGHPSVGALLAPHAFSDGTWEECSGTLISPTVFLTAAHCDLGLDRVAVTFDSSYNSSTGHAYWGTWHADPLFNQKQGDPHDVAVVVLDKPLKVAVSRLPELGQLDSLKVGDPITSVGYGAQSVTMGAAGATFHYADIRYVATGSVNALNASWIRASMNPATGDGGTCYGDSGGPNFLGDTNIVAGTTITGDFVCRATNVDYRMDTPSARSFLKDYVTLP
jgi:V8-like Glu-specific endopeptidase